MSHAIIKIRLIRFLYWQAYSALQRHKQNYFQNPKTLSHTLETDESLNHSADSHGTIPSSIYSAPDPTGP